MLLPALSRGDFSLTNLEKLEQECKGFDMDSLKETGFGVTSLDFQRLSSSLA